MGKEEEIISAYTAGESKKSLAIRYGVSEVGLLLVLTRNNVQIRTRAAARNTKTYNDHFSKVRVKIKDKEVIGNIIQEYQKGAGCVELAQKYGVVHGTIRLLLKRNNISTRTCKETQSSQYMKNYLRDINLKKYGVVSTMQLPEVFEKAQKSMFKHKTVNINEKEFTQLQGYEETGINYLLEHIDNITVDDILAGKECRNINIKYTHNGKYRVYFPDIYVPKLNMLVEIKSDYIFNLDIERNMSKHNACKSQGFNHIILVFDNKKKFVRFID